MRDRHHRLAYMAPLSILPLRVARVADIMVDRFDYTAWINVSLVAADLKRRGWWAQPITLPGSENGAILGFPGLPFFVALRSFMWKP